MTRRNDPASKVAGRTETWVNTETGEAREFQTVEKRYYGQRQFWKMYLNDFLAVLGIMENKQLDVICHILENVNPADNLYISTQTKTARDCGASRATVNKVVQKMEEANFMRCLQTGVYQINPSILIKGSEGKRRALVVEYRETAEDGENGTNRK